MRTLWIPLLLALTVNCAHGTQAAEPAADPHAHHHAHHAMHAEPGADSAAFDRGDAPSTDSLYWLEGAWSTSEGTEIALRNLEGKPVVLTMLYTTCKMACPVLVNDLIRIQKGFTEAERQQIRFVVVTMDPEVDTVEVLRAFQAKIPAAAAWTFLRAPDDRTYELAALLGIRYKKTGADIVHSNKITTLNARGEITHQAVGLRADPEETIQAVRMLLQ